MEGEILKGHLDMILLAALAAGPAHGYAIFQIGSSKPACCPAGGPT